MFRRRKGEQAEPTPGEDAPRTATPTGADDSVDVDVADPALDQPLDDRVDEVREEGSRNGPYDLEDAPDDNRTRIDIGSLRILPPPNGELRLEMNEQRQVIAVTYLVDGSMLQVHVFAAPRTEGLWDEVREELLAGVRTAGGSGEEATGSFGTELHARVPEKQGSSTLVPARFVGVDGPRWFLRGMFTGKAMTDDGVRDELEGLFRGIVVARGSDARAPRDPLPLHLPPEAAQAMDNAVAGEGAAEKRAPRPPQRGPEITETR